MLHIKISKNKETNFEKYEIFNKIAINFVKKIVILQRSKSCYKFATTLLHN
jgi:hypothetical protein